MKGQCLQHHKKSCLSKVVLIEAVHPLDETAPSLTLGYLAAFLLKHYGKVDIHITRSSGKLPLKLNHGDIVGITCFTQSYNYAKKLAKAIKKHNDSIPVIIGGHHISALPETMTEDMDVAVLYEGEKTFLRLVQLFLGQTFDKNKLPVVPGIAFYNNGKLIQTTPREFVNNIDIFPPPARFLMGIKPGRSIEMITSRGCPYRCTYCGSPTFWKKTRFHSAEYVINELEEIIEKYKPKRLSFVDDLFIANRNRFKMIIDHICLKGYQNHIVFCFTARANLVDENLCEMIKELNCEVGFGFESGSNLILKQIKGGNITVEDNERAVKLMNRYNIKIGSAFMLGLPHETLEDMEATYNFIVNNKIHGAAISIVTPLPGTELWNYAVGKGLVDSKIDWDKLRFNSKSSLKKKILINDIVSRRELERMFAKINNRIQRLLVTNYSLTELFMIARVDLYFIVRMILRNPSKVIAFTSHVLKRKLKIKGEV